MTLSVAELQSRSIEIFRELVDTYVETGEPVGSRTLSQRLGSSLSPATIRNIMVSLEDAGLLYSPHTSAGRLPTEAGMRYFVHGLLEIGEIDESDRQILESRCTAVGRDFESLFSEATLALAGLSDCASLILAPKTEAPLRQIEFLHLGTSDGRARALVVLINEDGVVENRIIEIPEDISPSILSEATRFLQSRMIGRTLADAKNVIGEELSRDRASLDTLTTKVIEAGIAVWAGGEEAKTGSLILRGQSHLLQNVTGLENLDKIRELFTVLEGKEAVCKLIDASIQAQGVQIFIGADNRLFDLAGCSLVVASCKGSRQQILGAIGVIGPTRMNYSRIIPMVDYTAKIIGRLLS
ncbi:MAG: heat-inducible transcriptional repressor HrcA [Alphaproteobacteria bacterium]